MRIARNQVLSANVLSGRIISLSLSLRLRRAHFELASMGDAGHGLWFTDGG